MLTYSANILIDARAHLVKCVFEHLYESAQRRFVYHMDTVPYI